ncbi:MAG: recombinase family protein [Bacteroidales bacterium]
MVALYSRVSTDKQQTENQNIRLVEYAKNKGLEYHLFEEVESTRKTRPVKQLMIEKARAGEYDTIIVYKLDRFARSSKELILIISELTNKGIGFISLTENLDFTTASGKLHFHILTAFAEFERELIRERTREGIRRAKLKGKSLGRPAGSKDAKPRRKSGYILKEARKRQAVDQGNGAFKPIEGYIDRE